MATANKLIRRRGLKRGDAARVNGNVVEYTRAEVEAKVDDVARDLGVSRAVAFRMLDRGELRGTVAEMRLAPLRFLLK